MTKLHSTIPLKSLNGEIKRRSEVVPKEDAVVLLIGALLLEQNDEWAVQGARYVTRVNCSIPPARSQSAAPRRLTTRPNLHLGCRCCITPWT